MQRAADALPSGPTVDLLRKFRTCGRCDTLARMGEQNDGGYVMCMDGLDKVVLAAFSYGISGFDGWGMGVASHFRIPVNEYDCTNPKVPDVCPGCQVQFHGECIRSADSERKPQFATLSEQLAAAGFANATDGSLLLKMDVEGAEWQIFAEETVENMRKFREIVVEYHDLDRVSGHPLYLRAVKKFEEAGFLVAHLHGNNWGGMSKFDEFSIPSVLEVTYVRGRGCQPVTQSRLPLDAPNNPGGAELPDAVLPQ